MKKILAEGLVKKLEEIHTKDELKVIDAGFKTEKRKPTFRINTLKANKDKTIENLIENGLKISKVSYLDNAFTLDEGTEKDLWNTGAFKAGYIYMQGISSMIPPLLFDFDEDSSKTKLLDVTAAPGSKTSQLSMLMNNKGQIIACDNNEIRVDKLKFTIKRQGCTNVGVVKKNAVNLAKELKHQFEAAPEEYFDKILFDAPCSAEGRMNLNIEKTHAYWKEAIPKRNYKLQKDIISNAITMLKPGGELVYSTCTLSPEENEGLVHFVLSMFPEIELVDLSTNKILKKLKTKKGLKFYGKNPYRKDIINTVRILPTSEYEGFYVAKFIKKAV